MSSQPLSPSTTSGGNAITVIGQTLRVEGSVKSTGDVIVNGEVSGTIDSESRVTIAAGGTAKATVQATEVFVAGSIVGNVNARERLQLSKGASLVGDVKTSGITIEDGAFFKGGIDITRPAAASA
jgi:cytoskeletal protein CcmA (bactofilin family)